MREPMSKRQRTVESRFVACATVPNSTKVLNLGHWHRDPDSSVQLRSRGPAPASHTCY